jgi:hypothetical protein
VLQALNVGAMTKADIGDYRCYRFRCVILFAQANRSARAKAAEPVSQVLASVRAIRNQKDLAVT